MTEDEFENEAREQEKTMVADKQYTDGTQKLKMRDEVQILIANNDMGHATLIRKNLKRSGLSNKIIHFKDSQELLDFFFDNSKDPHWHNSRSYLLLLDILMPKVDGVEALHRIKGDNALKKIPVIMLTTTDDSAVIEKCHSLGCNSYIVKPIDYENFVEAIKKTGCVFVGD